MAEIADVLNNPYTGWAPWAEYGPYPQPHRLVYALLKWSEIEPAKENFNWSNIETRLKFNYWADRGVKIILRVEMDHPGSDLSHRDIPEWLYSEINREGTFYTSGSNSGGFSPNYRNAALISNHQRMITAMGQRYNNDPRIAFVAIGSIGHWGEFHTFYVQPGASGYMPEISISDQYVRHYLNAFTNKKLLMRRPFQIAKDNNIGLYNDMFGNPEETERFLRYVNSGYTNSGNYGVAAGTYPAMPDFWRYAPSGGEIGDSPGLQYFQDSTIQRTIQYAISSHTSWLGPACPGSQPSNTSLQANFDSLHNILGYRFVLQSQSYPSSINAGSALNITIQLNNKGAAPFYFNWPLELSLSTSNNNIVLKSNTSEDIRTWLPGVKNTTLSLSIPQNLAAGNYSLNIAIIDPESDVPGIDFANTGRRADGRYALGQVTVVSSQPTNPPVITGISVTSVTTSSATVNWTTDRGSNSQVEYGTTTAYGTSTPLNVNMVTAHSVQLTGLTPSTTYQFRVKSADAQGISAVSGNNSFATEALPDIPPPVTIDGDASDWNNISAIAEPTLTSLKVTNDSTRLYLCVEGVGLNVKSQFYFDTNNSSSTGFRVTGWSANGCEYLLENNLLHRYTGTGSNWSWSLVGSMTFAKNNTVIEAAIPFSSMQLAAGRTIRLGFLLNNSAYAMLPEPAKPLAPYTLK